MQKSSYCCSKESLEVQISCDTTENDTTIGISNTSFMGYTAGCMTHEAINKQVFSLKLKIALKIFYT
jgi:hypothetical protein